MADNIRPYANEISTALEEAWTQVVVPLFTETMPASLGVLLLFLVCVEIFVFAVSGVWT